MGAAMLATPTLRPNTGTAARIKVFISVSPSIVGRDVRLRWNETSAYTPSKDNPDLDYFIYALRAEIWIERLSVPYQIVGTMMARSLQEDAARNDLLFAWIVMDDVPEYLGAVLTQLVTNAPTPYVLIA